MSRPPDWSAVDRGSDPTPGDNTEAARLARRYQDTAEEIDRQAASLTRLAASASEAWDSEASKAFAKHAEDLAGNITKAHGRYAAAAAALHGWTDPRPSLSGLSPMEAAQKKADLALQAAVQAQADLRANSPEPAPVPAQGQTDPDPAAVAAHKNRETAYHDAGVALHKAKTDVQAAEDDYTAAAREAAAQIDAVSHHDSLHDSFWDRVSGWIHDHAGIIKSVLKVVGWVVTALAVAALVASLFIPGVDILGAIALSTLLDGLVTGGAAVMFVGHAALAANGDGSWLDAGLDLLAVGGFFGGRALAGAIARGAEHAIEPAAAAAASRASQQFLESNARSIARWTLASRIPVLRTLLGASSRLEAFSSGAARAAEEARQLVLHLPEAGTTFASRLRYGGEEAAAGIGKLKGLTGAVPGLPELENALSTATSTAARNALLKYGLLGVDLTNHAVEETTKWKDIIEPYVTHPILPLPWKVLAPVGGGE